MGLSLQIYGAIARILALSLLLVGGLGVLWSPSAGAQQPTSEEEVRGRIQTLRAQGRLDERLPEGLRQAVGQVSKTLGLEQQRGLATGSPRKLKKKEANLVTRAGAGLTGVSSSSTSIADVDGDGNRDLLITGRDANGDPTATLYLGDGQGGFSEAGASGDQAYSRSECSGGCQFGPGVGFWLIAGQAWQVDRTVETVTLSAGGTVQISVQDGWNAVSNPLETDVQWSAVQQATGTEQPLWRWSGSWQQAQTFRSAKEGDAYYFRDDQVGQLTVPFPGVSGNAAQATADTARSQKRALALSVLRIGEPVTTVEAGVRPGTEAGLDRHDLYGPPGYFGLATLRLMQEDPQADQARPTALAAEYRAPGGEGHSFASGCERRPTRPLPCALKTLIPSAGTRWPWSRRPPGRPTIFGNAPRSRSSRGQRRRAIGY